MVWFAANGPDSGNNRFKIHRRDYYWDLEYKCMNSTSLCNLGKSILQYLDARSVFFLARLIEDLVELIFAESPDEIASPDRVDGST